MSRRHPQFDILDSVRFRTSRFNNKYEEGNVSDGIERIGQNRTEKTISLDQGLFIPPHFTRYLDSNIRTGINLGAALSGLNINLHGAPDKETIDMISSYNPPVIFDLSIGRTSIDDRTLDMADCIWVDPGNPEPGYGPSTFKPGDPYIPELKEKKDLIHFVRMLKELSDVPVIASLRGTDAMNDLDSFLVTDADGIHISCGFDPGMGRGPAFDGLTSEPISSIIEANKHLEVFRSREKGVKVLLSGPVRNGSDILKLISLGTDFVGPEYMLCSLLEGLEEKEGKGLDWDVVGEGVENSISELKRDISVKLGLLGKGSLNELSVSDLMVDNYHAAAVTGLPIQGYGKEIPFWRH